MDTNENHLLRLLSLFAANLMSHEEAQDAQNGLDQV
jgi:hypothetical protein